MFKVNLDGFLAHPFHTGLFIADFALLTFLPFVRPPVILSMLLVAGLVYLSMFFGAAFTRGKPQRGAA